MNRENELKQQLEMILRSTTQTRKHSAYQTLPKRVANLIGKTDIKLSPKYERERLLYVCSKIDVTNKSILDIGFNTGFFLFEFLDKGAKSCTGYEGGEAHYNFVKIAVELLNEKRIHPIKQYFPFGKTKKKYDITLLLNILHHIGDDFGEASNIAKLKTEIKKHFVMLENITSIIIFQMGFNWRGDINKGIFKNGTKGEMIDFVRESVDSAWDILAIGIPEKEAGKVKYKDLNNKNIIRDDSLGEFLNRPLFIMKKKLT